ncbi:hypothetical protein ACFXKC_50975 [Streptomyces sp. NPDC059340]|uniref:nuclear transport factor 2 family protein n=1 Tax=Streptomyces sp. NPDC059340 TaxID=3346806 RepID=UPI0036A146D8
MTPTRIDHNGGYSQRQKALMRTVEDRNKAIVREAFDALFNKRDYAAAERFWSPDYVQHSAHIPSGREWPFDLVKSLPAELKHDP